MTFGQKLRSLRENHDLSQIALAERLNISNVTISQYEKGVRNPDLETLTKIANYFNVTTDYLLGNDQPKKDWTPTLNEKDKIDIAEEVEAMLEGLSDNPISFELDGHQIDDEIKETLRSSLQNTLEFARLKAKEKYTPNKYKK